MLLRRYLGPGLLVSVLLGVSCGGEVIENSGGGGGGGGASTGVGGGLPAACALPQVIGPCKAAFPAYWHNPTTGVCEPFTYGGCDGNANRFDSLDACQLACRGGSPDMDACVAPGDCVLASPHCCAACDPVDDRPFVAIHRGFAADYPSAIGCSGVACSPCAEVSEIERTAQYYAATCESGRCVVLDVRESALTRCAEDAECILRDGVDCCQGCDGRGIVAVNRDADLEALVCDSRGQACPACEPQFPPGMTPVCSGGQCRGAVVERR